MMTGRQASCSCGRVVLGVRGACDATNNADLNNFGGLFRQHNIVHDRHISVEQIITCALPDCQSAVAVDAHAELSAGQRFRLDLHTPFERLPPFKAPVYSFPFTPQRVIFPCLAILIQAPVHLLLEHGLPRARQRPLWLWPGLPRNQTGAWGQSLAPFQGTSRS